MSEESVDQTSWERYDDLMRDKEIMWATQAAEDALYDLEE